MPLHAHEPFFGPPHERRLAEHVLHALARVRFARETSLFAFAREHGLGPEVLDRWHAAGLIHRGRFHEDPIEGRDEPFVALTMQGARELSRVTGLTVEGTSPARLKVSSQKRAHDVGVGEAALAVLSLADRGRIRLMGLETDDRKLVSTVTTTDGKGHARSIGLQPDALVMTRGAHGPAALAVEYDRGTTSVIRMRAKYCAYLCWRDQSGPMRDYSVRAVRVLTIVPDARRLRRLIDAALAATKGKPSGFLLFALAADVTVKEPERLLQPIALRLSESQEPRVPLFEPTPATAERPAA